MNTNKRICLVFMSLLFTVILVCYLPENKPEFQVGIFSSISNGYVEGKMSSNPDELPLTKTLSKVRELGKSCSHGEKDAHKMSSSPATLRLNINKLNKIKVWKFAREDTKKANEIGTHSKTFSNVRPFRDQTTKSEVFESSFEESKKAQFKESKKSSPSIKPSNVNELKTSNREMKTSDERTANILNTPREELKNADHKTTTTNNFSSSSSFAKTLPNLDNLENKISTLRLDIENSDLNRTFCRTNSKFRNGLMCPKLYTELGGRCFYNGTKPVCTDIRRKARYSLRKSQLAITRMLGILDLIARRHNLTYWLTSGTLLGAVRHQGFIPWDSDADIGMSLQDYEKFFRTASRDLPSDIFFQNTESDPNLRPEQSYLYEGFKYKDIGMYIRIWNPRLRDTKSCNKVCIMYNCKFHDGLMIDMFIQEKIPNKTFPLKYVLFEGLVFPVQNNWKEALTGLYGSDYMLLPKQGNKNRVQLDYPEPLMSCDEFRELLAKSVRRRKLRKKKIGKKLKP